MADNACPRKPKVDILKTSLKLFNFVVVPRRQRLSKFEDEIPLPLSVINIWLIPPSIISIRIEFAWESMLLSKSSFIMSVIEGIEMLDVIWVIVFLSIFFNIYLNLFFNNNIINIIYNIN